MTPSAHHPARWISGGTASAPADRLIETGKTGVSMPSATRTCVGSEWAAGGRTWLARAAGSPRPVVVRAGARGMSPPLQQTVFTFAPARSTNVLEADFFSTMGGVRTVPLAFAATEPRQYGVPLHEFAERLA